jgi:hypothetical protein
MAAVFALVFLPALAAVGFMVKSVRGDISFGAAIAGTTFFLLAAFVFAGALGIVKRAEDEPA